VCHVRKSVQRILKKQGLEFKLNTKVVNAVKKDSEIQVTIEPAKGGSQQQLECDTLLVCIGRKPYTSDIGLEVFYFKFYFENVPLIRDSTLL
jgi:dihydrolipoamide dehydrogenase